MQPVATLSLQTCILVRPSRQALWSSAPAQEYGIGQAAKAEALPLAGGDAYIALVLDYVQPSDPTTLGKV